MAKGRKRSSISRQKAIGEIERIDANQNSAVISMFAMPHFGKRLQLHRKNGGPAIACGVCGA
jgi:hypothetical protein